MEVFCTYCSKEKDEMIDLLPAIHRYKSKRIRKINEAANLLGFPMFILSGEYGLICTDSKIPYYDHLLLQNEVQSLVKEKVEPQLRERDINKIFFFLNPSDPNIKPYIDTISEACKLDNTKIIFVEVNIGEREDIVKIGYREIWYSSLKSNQIMVRNKDISASAFSDLMEKYPNDGMIFYERAEAFECLGELDKSKNDYEQALFYFPNPKWKKVAYEGLKRIQQSQGFLKRSGELDRKWEFFHKVNSFVYIPHETRIFVLSALERYHEEKRLAIGELRICLEILVSKLSAIYKITNRIFFQEIDFPKKIKKLTKAGCGSDELGDEMLRCWRKMSKIIHPIKYVDIPDIDYEITVESFIRVLEICNKERLLPLD